MSRFRAGSPRRRMRARGQHAERSISSPSLNPCPCRCRCRRRPRGAETSHAQTVPAWGHQHHARLDNVVNNLTKLDSEASTAAMGDGLEFNVKVFATNHSTGKPAGAGVRAIRTRPRRSRRGLPAAASSSSRTRTIRRQRRAPLPSHVGRNPHDEQSLAGRGRPGTTIPNDLASNVLTS